MKKISNPNQRTKKKSVPNFNEFEGGLADTANYVPPKFLTKPAPGDTGFALVNQEFKKQKAYFVPNLKTKS